MTFDEWKKIVLDQLEPSLYKLGMIPSFIEAHRDMMSDLMQRSYEAGYMGIFEDDGPANDNQEPGDQLDT